jgi:uncharacterized protein
MRPWRRGDAPVALHVSALAGEPGVSELLGRQGFDEARRLCSMRIVFDAPPARPPLRRAARRQRVQHGRGEALPARGHDDGASLRDLGEAAPQRGAPPTGRERVPFAGQGATGRGMYRGPVIDCDIHHDWASPSELLPYLSAGWREYVTRSGAPQHIPVSPSEVHPNPGGVYRDDAFPPEGGPPGSSYELVRTQLLDPYRVERGLLTFGGGTYVAALANPYFATEVARAANDWSLETWASRDERLYSTVLVANQLPEEGAKEIRRLGGHPRVAAALLATNGIGKPFGHPLFHPIYEAAVEMDLPVAIHAAGESFASMRVSPVGSGVPSLYLEHHTLVPQGVMTHLVSMIVHGVFERFPTLRVLLIEAGVAWIPAVLWRFDMDYKGLRRETPWLRRHPSEYFYEHVRITTQPLEVAPRREQLQVLLRLVDAGEILCFSSDYPHWDTDDVTYVAQHLPEEWHARVFRENARALFGWDRTAAAAEGALAAGAP